MTTMARHTGPTGDHTFSEPVPVALARPCPGWPPE